MEFKIGDTVEVVSEICRDAKHLIGMVGTVVKVSGGAVDIDFGKPIGACSNKVNETTHTSYRSEIKLVETVEIKEEKLKNFDLIIMQKRIIIRDKDGDMIELEKEDIKEIYNKIY